MLNGKVAVVVGGGGGIGAACAQYLATAGAKVAVADLSQDQAASVADRSGGYGIAVDTNDEGSVEACARRIESEVGAVDILVNCAAMFQAPVPPAILEMEKWDQVVRVAFRGTYLCCSLFGGRMVKRGRGAIINIASIAGMRSLPLHGYGPAKAAVISLTESLAAEWGPYGVRVNAISPGFTRTPGMQAAIAQRSDVEDAIVQGTALGRLVEPDEVAGAVQFLASPAAGAITGINLPVDCGWLAGASWQAYGGLRKSEAVDSSQ